MGLPVENDLLLAITSGQIIAESKFDTHKDPLSSTFTSITIVFISHVICHMIIFLKILNI